MEETRKYRENAKVLACPARDDADRLALEMLGRLLDPAKWQMEIIAVETLAAELLAMIETTTPAIVCIGSLRLAALHTPATSASG